MLSYRDCWYRLGITLLIAFSIPDQGLAVINLQDKHVSQSSNYNDAYPSKAVDGDIYSISHTQCSGYQWWRVDLVTTHCVERITIVNRLDGYGDRLAGAVVRAGVNSVHSQNQQIGSAVRSSQASPDGQTIHFVANPSVRARYVSVELSNNCLQLAELRIEEEAPDPVSSLQISQPVGTSHNQLVVTWTEPANHCPVDAYIIRYTLTRIKACSTNISNPVTVSRTVASSVTSETLDSLKPYSEYSVSVVAGNSAGYSIALEAYGETSAIEPSFLPTVTVLETTSTTLRYSWDEIPCDEVNGPSSSYQYRVSVTDISIRGSQSHPTHYRATRTAGWLKPCRPYSIKMAAINDIGLGPYGSAQEATTPSGVVLGLSANAVNGYPTMLQVSWNRPSANCIITDYTLSYSLTRMVNCETEVSNRIVAGTTADTEYSITGLSPYSNYTIYVAARTSAGEGDESFVHGSTAEAVPTEPPSDVINTSRQKQGLRFEWQPPPCLGRRGVITGYGYRLLDLERGGADITENTPSYERQAEISGLVPCTLYSFQVLARTAAGDGPYSEAITLRTGLGTPGPVSSLQVFQPDGISHNQLGVTWSASADTNCPVDAYIISYTLTRILACSSSIADPVTVTQTVSSSVTTVSFNNLKPYSRYSVAVVAMNSAGNSTQSTSTQSTTSTVSSFIPTVNLQESDVTSDSIRFTWDEVPCEELNSPLSYYNYKTELRNQATGELFSSNLRYQVKRATQLTPCTSYSFKVAVRNTIGIGSYSNATEVTTSTVAPSQVQALSVDSVEDQPTALRVRWNQPSGNCPIDNYTIHYDLVWLSQCEIPESNRTLVGTTEGTEYSITGLFPHSRYKVDVTAKTSAGEGDRSYVYADTADAAPSEPPRGITNTATLERGLRFEWQPPSCQGRRGIITGYGYRLLDLEERGVNITENTPSNETQADVSGLVPYTLYSFQVLARTSAGDGPYSEAIRLRTAQAKPPQVPMVTTPSGNATSITVRWRRPDPPHGIIIAYYIRYGIVLQGNEEVKVTEGLNDTVLEFVLTGLVADSNYSMQVQAETIVSRGSWSEPSFGTTLETVPSAPVGVHLDNKGDNCLVTWNPPEQGDVISYKIFRNAYLIPRDGSDDLDPIPDLNASDFVVTDDTTPRTYSVKKSDLATYTRYRFQISASTQAGEGSVSKETNSICDSPRAAPVELQQPMISDTPGNPVFDRTFKVTIGSISQRNGPVSCVEITIIWLKTDENVEGTDPDILYHPDLYRSYEDAKVTQGLPYVAVVLEGNDLIESKEVTIGSGGKSECQSTGSRRKRRQAPMIHEGENGALMPDSKYTAFIRAYVVLDNGMEDYVTSPLLQPVWTAQATDFTAIIAGMCVLSVVLLVVLIAFGVILRRRRAKSFQPSPTVVTTNVEMDEIDYERPIKPDDRQSTVYEDVGLPTWALRWEILWKNLVVDDKVLGQGNFGEVRLGTVNVSGKKTETAIKVCVLSVVLLVVLIAFGVILRRRRAKSFQPSPTVVTTNVEMDEIDYERPIKPDDRQSTVYEDVGLPTWALRWEILWKNLVVDDKVLGQGNFGEVRLGTVNVSGKKTETAIKVLKGRASETDREDFMEEFRTMTNIGYHPNVVSLLGACQHKDVLYVALEYLPKGDLRSYLRTGRLQSESDEGALSSDQLIKFALDVAKGMEHLAMSGVIHRDLAARNILLGETLVAKVSDFGLSRGEDIYVQMSKRRVPTRWLAIESLTSRTYTTQSDVWSFGILLWEIASIGGTPYATIATKSLLARLMQGYRMPKPINCDKEIFSLMLRCWEEDPSNRPSFSDLVRIFSDLSDKKVQHTYMAIDRAHYANFSVIRPERDDN